MTPALVLALSFVSFASAAAPGAPQNLTATVVGSTVNLTWQPPAIGGLPSSYLVEAALSPAGTVIATLTVSGTSLSVPNVPNGVYYVRVRAVNSDGASDVSNEVIAAVPGSPPGCTLPPNPPQRLVGSVTGNVVGLSWSAPVGGCAATSYAVQAGSAPGASNIAVLNVGAATSVTASAPPGTYYIRVIALNAFGGSSASNEVTVVVRRSDTFGFTLPAGSTSSVVVGPVLAGNGSLEVTLNFSGNFVILACVGTTSACRPMGGRPATAVFRIPEDFPAGAIQASVYFNRNFVQPPGNATGTVTFTYNPF